MYSVLRLQVSICMVTANLNGYCLDSCFITIQSKNAESYMFHTPNILLTGLQAKAAQIPLISEETAGEEERELDDLTRAIRRAKREFNLDGIVSGAIQSVYQASRIERICHDQGLWCLSPLWLCDQKAYMEDLIQAGFDVIIAGVFSAPFDERWLGERIESDLLERLIAVRERFGISLTGEGGEYESLVCDAPFFSRRIRIEGHETFYKNHNGRFLVTSAHLEEK